MKKRMKKLQLSRETLHALTDFQAAGALAAEQQAVGNLSISPCTKVLSDCLTCTQPIDGCPDPTVVAV
jgi:hypothetical protein